jgi:hypothetical protein
MGANIAEQLTAFVITLQMKELYLEHCYDLNGLHGVTEGHNMTPDLYKNLRTQRSYLFFFFFFL